MAKNNGIGHVLKIGLIRKEIEIVAPTEQQLERLRSYVGKDVNIKRDYNFSFIDDDGDTLSGIQTENQTIRLEEVAESAIKGKLQDEDITMEFIEVHSGLIQTNYVGLNHPMGFRYTGGKRYIDEIRCGDEVLYEATLKKLL